MRKIAVLLLVLSLLLCGCSELVPPKTTMPSQEETTAPIEETTEPTEEPTTEPTTEPAPVYTNPLNGQVIDAPFDGRVFAITISNIHDALPHYGTNKADILVESWVNGSIVRDLALFTNPFDVPQIGSVRSTRLMFNDIATHYDAIVLDAGGSDQVINDAKNIGLDRFNVDTAVGSPNYYAFRDMEREFTFNVSSKLEHCLFVNGEGVEQLAEEKGFSLKQDPEKSYNLQFVEDGTPAEGEDASTVDITLTYSSYKKKTLMVYDADLGKYVLNQYDQPMIDGATGEPEAFTNVIVMMAKVTMNNIYQVADFVAGGEGYFACGGKIIPITWGAEDETSPFWFKTMDGEMLNLGVGNTYIAITANGSEVAYE